MAYSFDRDETVLEGLRRNARSELDDAVAALDDPSALGLVESVHDVRKRCKKLRALARLARKSIDDYAGTNAAFRDAARELSGIRDTQVLLEVFDDLVAAAPEGVELPDLAPVREALATRHDEVTEALRADDAPMLRARALLAQGWDAIEDWDLDDDFDALAGGLAKTYRRARKAFERSQEAPTTEHLHEWRKRVKYHWYHVRMFTDAAPGILEPWADRLHDLADLLGDDHDLAVFVKTLQAAPAEHGGEELVDAVCVLADGRRADLQRRAFSLGARLTAEDPDAVVDRLRVCWEAWHTHGDAPEATELADLRPVLWQDPRMALSAGDRAPAFTLLDQQGEKVKLTDQKGSKVLVYFYPKADTPGCTTQACELSAIKDDIDVQILGISPDEPDKQKRFDDKHGIGFPLLSDPDHKVADKYGAWGEKSMYGKKYMGIVRSAFLIGENGKILEAWPKISPKDTPKKLLKTLKELEG